MESGLLTQNKDKHKHKKGDFIQLIGLKYGS